MKSRTTFGSATAVALLIVRTAACAAPPQSASLQAAEKVLREYVGVYQWRANAFVYLQLWSEFTGHN